ncbi:hypothetical protein SeMB42_g00993 [Synchytrium endobioticum]|uniref:Alpha/beta hydrolase fold-3 domain-containing protein n=1 Tax=Synchytrium endobioticum TaxID=286115 RepID=A0A507DNK1_9FUNG|nr:hypothetical protein SeLEV6574_g06500 [Synchytrium endobioticum]TPX53096.1 hypothetical protein SeMB42_g00993 [Synchytrium endobioticum]
MESSSKMPDAPDRSLLSTKAAELLIDGLARFDRPHISLSVTIQSLDIPRQPLSGFETNISGSFSAELYAPSAAGKADDLPMILYCHGGGYRHGNTLTHRGVTTGLAKRGVRVLSINYRLAPFPAAWTDGLSAYRYLLESINIPASNIVISGDSAGGGLTYGIALLCRDQGLPMPAGLAPISPWVDISCAGPCFQFDDEFAADILVPANLSKSYAKIPSHARLPYVSPLYDIPSKRSLLPAQIITTGTVDRLLAECLAMYLKRTEAGEIVQLYIFEDGMHVFQLLPFIPSCTTALDLGVSFAKDVCNGKDIRSATFWVKNDGKTVTEIPRQHVKNRLEELLNRAKKAIGDDPVKLNGLAPYSISVAQPKL